MTIEIRAPQTEREFEDYYLLRWKILRKAWNQPRGSETDELEETSFHLIAVDNERIIGCCRVQMNSETEAQLRYMVVDEGLQGKGIGKLLLMEAENVAKKAGAETVILESREKAVDFYKQNGYKVDKESYLLFGEIQHYTMSKIL